MVIVGLGNIGKEYQNTYHNMGFCVIDRLAELLGKRIDKPECASMVSVFSKNNKNIVLAKPSTYMNNSGEAVNSLIKKYQCDTSALIVIYDDIDIEPYATRMRLSGSAGTHNGMRSIISCIKTENFLRIRVGIGRGSGDLANFVLSTYKKDDAEKFQITFNKIAEALVAYISDENIDALMRAINN